MADQKGPSKVDAVGGVIAVDKPIELEQSNSSVRFGVKESNPLVLDSIRGISQCESKTLNQLTQTSEFAAAHSKEIAKLWVVARLDPSVDRGGDLQALIQLFDKDSTLREKREQLLLQLYRVATADSLFGLSAQEYQQRGVDFSKLRSEYLVEQICGVIDSDKIRQGKEALCPAAVMNQMLSRAEALRVACEYALNGQASTESGATIQMWSQYVDRAIENSQGELGAIKCARPSPGSLMLLYGLFQMGEDEEGLDQPLIVRQQGLYMDQYTLALQRLCGREVICAHRSATIRVDSENGVYRDDAGADTAGTKVVDLSGYVMEQVRHGRRVFIDTLFDHSSATSATSAEHSRHALLAKKEVYRNGEQWLLCANPIRDFVNTSRNNDGHSEVYSVGTRLGQPSGFWFEVADDGNILVRADVLRRNIQTALIVTDKAYNIKDGNTVRFLGDVSAIRPQRIFFFDSSSDVTPIQSGSGAEVIEEILAELFSEHDAPTMRDKDSLGGAQSVGGTSRNPVVRRRELLLDDSTLESILRAQELQQERANTKVRDDTDGGEGIVADAFRIEEPSSPPSYDYREPYHAQRNGNQSNQSAAEVATPPLSENASTEATSAVAKPVAPATEQPTKQSGLVIGALFGGNNPVGV